MSTKISNMWAGAFIIFVLLAFLLTSCLLIVNYLENNNKSDFSRPLPEGYSYVIISNSANNEVCYTFSDEKGVVHNDFVVSDYPLGVAIMANDYYLRNTTNVIIINKVEIEN